MVWCVVFAKREIIDAAPGFPVVQAAPQIAFDAGGEWAQSRVLTVQFRGIKGSGLDQYMRTGTQVILDPPAYRDGEPAPFPSD